MYAETTDGLKSEPVHIRLSNEAYTEAAVINFELDPKYTNVSKTDYYNVIYFIFLKVLKYY